MPRVLLRAPEIFDDDEGAIFFFRTMKKADARG
jgi:hypothetical protein